MSKERNGADRGPGAASPTFREIFSHVWQSPPLADLVWVNLYRTLQSPVKR